MEKTKTFQLTESQYNLVEELLEIAPGHTEAEKLISALELAVEVGAHTYGIWHPISGENHFVDGVPLVRITRPDAEYTTGV